MHIIFQVHLEDFTLSLCFYKGRPELAYQVGSGEWVILWTMI